jgi:3-oxoacyl-[acyl-carrier protein] reductase
MIDTGLQGKVALVTGANNPMGIGAATAKALAAQGAAVLLHYRRRPGVAPNPNVTDPGHAFYAAQQARPPDAILLAMRNAGARVESLEADLADPATIPRIFDYAESALGPVEVLVHSAAYSGQDSIAPVVAGTRDRYDRPLAAITAQSHDDHFAVNSRAAALLMAEFARRHVARGAQWGRIITISTDGASAFPGEVSYGASKHALESYSRAAAKELRAYGITVNVVSPGPIQTGWAPPDAARQMQPVLGRPDDVADVIVFLASTQARWLTGQLLYVGNGHCMPL